MRSPAERPIAAAHVSGIAALLLERNPALKPGDIRSILIATANGRSGRRFRALSFRRRSGECLSRRKLHRSQARRPGAGAGGRRAAKTIIVRISACRGFEPRAHWR